MTLKKQYDLVIVGGGASGFAAGYEAAHNGLDTVILEKGHSIGGSGNHVEGIFAVNSFMQKKHDDYKLTEEDALNEELSYSHYKADTNTWKQYIAGSADIIQWLDDLGVK